MRLADRPQPDLAADATPTNLRTPLDSAPGAGFIVCGMTTVAPTIVERAAAPYAAIPVTVTMDKRAGVVPPLNGEVFAWLAAHGGAPNGPPFWKYNVIDMARGLEIEAGVTVAQPVAGDGRVIASELPAGR